MKNFFSRLCSSFPKFLCSPKGYMDLFAIIMLAVSAVTAASLAQQLTNPNAPQNTSRIASNDSQRIAEADPNNKTNNERCARDKGDFRSDGGRCDSEIYRYCIEGKCYENQNGRGYECGENADCRSDLGLTCINGTCQEKNWGDGACDENDDDDCRYSRCRALEGQDRCVNPCATFFSSNGCNQKQNICFWYVGINEGENSKCIERRDGQNSPGVKCGEGYCYGAASYCINNTHCSAIPPQEGKPPPPPPAGPPINTREVTVSGQITATGDKSKIDRFLVSIFSDGHIPTHKNFGRFFYPTSGYSVSYFTSVSRSIQVCADISTLINEGYDSCRDVTIQATDTSVVVDLTVNLGGNSPPTDPVNGGNGKTPPAPPPNTNPPPGDGSNEQIPAPQPNTDPKPSGEGYCGANDAPNYTPAPGNTNPCPRQQYYDETHSFPKYNYCQKTFGNNHAYWYACPASGGAAPPGGGEKPSDTNLCAGKGVNSSSHHNGYFGPICMNETPNSSNYEKGLFSLSKSKKGDYKNAKYYDVYTCNGGTFDFTPKDNNGILVGVPNICDKYPWTQIEGPGGNIPTPPAGSECKDPTPYWNSGSKKCEPRPWACPNSVGGKENVCQAAACAANSSPNLETGITKDEANALCKQEIAGASFCCAKPTTSVPTQPNPPQPNPGSGITPNSCGRTGANAGQDNHCYNGDNDCACGYKCSNPLGGATASCHAVGAGSPGSFCDTSTGFKCAKATGGNANTACQTAHGDTWEGVDGNPGAHDACRSAGMTFCCKPKSNSSTVPPAASGCPGSSEYKFPDGTSGKSVCQKTEACPSGTRRGSAANDAACGALFCCIDERYTGSTASTNNEIVLSSCKTNIECVNNNLGNVCVFYAGSVSGTCRAY